MGHDTESLLLPSINRVDLSSGVMEGRTGVKRSLLRELAGLFADGIAFERLISERGAEVAYEVNEFRPQRVAPQELVFGTSIVQPGRVGSEFFMTRGHIHVLSDRPEVYFCQRGRGVLHMETLTGETHPVAMGPGAVVYVPAHWVHRSVNVGDEPLITFFCYPADAGQDYGVIERARGMRTLIVDDGAVGWAEAENSRYRPRSPEEARRYMAGGQP